MFKKSTSECIKTRHFETQIQKFSGRDLAPRQTLSRYDGDIPYPYPIFSSPNN